MEWFNSFPTWFDWWLETLFVLIWSHTLWKHFLCGRNWGRANYKRTCFLQKNIIKRKMLKKLLKKNNNKKKLAMGRWHNLVSLKDEGFGPHILADTHILVRSNRHIRKVPHLPQLSLEIIRLACCRPLFCCAHSLHGNRRLMAAWTLQKGDLSPHVKLWQVWEAVTHDISAQQAASFLFCWCIDLHFYFILSFRLLGIFWKCARIGKPALSHIFLILPMECGQMVYPSA